MGCKKMKPDWDKLAKEFDGHATTLVADVDCTAGGKPLCDKVGVRGYPTIKHGDVNNLEDYKGGRDFASLQKFANGLKPVCSPAKLDLCEDETAATEAKFKSAVDELQKKYQELQEEKEATLQAVKDSGHGLMKSVKAMAGQSEL